MCSLAQEPEALWKQFLSLGEDLLSQSETSTIIQHLVERVSLQFSCHAQVYLAEPGYPLPGDAPQAILPKASAPEIVFQAYTKKKIQKNSTGKSSSPGELAIPLTTQGTFLAVLHVWKDADLLFTRQETELLQGIASYAAVAMQINRQVILKNWRFEQISLVRSVSGQITNILDIDELCHRVTQLIQSSFGYYFVAIFTLDSGSDHLTFRSSTGETENLCLPGNLNLKIGEGMVGFSAKTGQERIAKDVKHDAHFKPVDTLPETQGEATLPLIVEGRILGVLDVQSRSAESFHESDMLVLRSLADNIALAIEGAHLYHDLRQRAEQLSAVLEINNALSSVLDLDTLLEEVVQRIHERFNYPFVHIFTVHPGRRKVIYQTGSGIRYQHLRSNSFAYELDAEKGLIPLVARTGKAILANDVSKEPNYLPSRLPPHDTRSEMTIPLTFGKDVLGVLDLQSDQLNSFSDDDLELFEGLAGGIAIALRNANLFRTEKWRREVADSFQDVAKLLSANLELSSLLDRVLTELEKILPCDAAAIWLLEGKNADGTNKPLRLAAVHGTSQVKLIRTVEENPAIRDFLEHSLEQTAPTIRKPTDTYGPLGFACKMQSNYSSISVPLRAGEKILGTLTMAHHLDGRYGSEASAITGTFANYAAVAIQNAALFSSAQEEAWSSTVLLQVADAAKTITNEEELLSTMNRLIPLLVGIEQCAFYIFDEANKRFVLKSWFGFHPDIKEQSESGSDTLPFLKLITTHESVYITNTTEELNLPSLAAKEKAATILLLPISSRSDVMGALLVTHVEKSESRIEDKFSSHTLPILQGIAQQTAVALENIRLLETREEEAYITAVLLQVAQAVVSQNNLPEILDSIIHLMPFLVGIENCVIYLWDKTQEKFLPAQVISTDREMKQYLNETVFCAGDFLLLDEVRQSLKMGVCELSGSEVNTPDWKSKPLAHTSNLEDELLRNGKNWLLGFPLSVKNEFYGVLLVNENHPNSTYSKKRLELLNGVAQQISLAIQDDHLQQDIIGRERIEREIQVARQIQKTFLPDKMPKIKGWNLDLRWDTAREVGGDFYDVFPVHPHRFAFTIADVADKGVPAALYMTVTRTLIHSSAQNLTSPAKVLQNVNEQLLTDTQNGMFITTFFGFLDPASGVVDFANAGHNLPLLFRGDTGKVERLPKGEIALGVVEEGNYSDHKLTIREGDALLLYTDGVTETFSPDGEIFGEQRLIEEMQSACINYPDNVLEQLIQKIDEFRANGIQSDDLTMLLLQRKK